MKKFPKTVYVYYSDDESLAACDHIPDWMPAEPCAIYELKSQGTIRQTTWIKMKPEKKGTK